VADPLHTTGACGVRRGLVTLNWWRNADMQKNGIVALTKNHILENSTHRVSEEAVKVGEHSPCPGYSKNTALLVRRD